MINAKNQAIQYYNEGIKLYKSGLYEQALVQYQKAIDFDSSFPFAHIWKAKTLARLKKYDEGVTYFVNHIDLVQKSKQGPHLLGFSSILIEEEQPVKALSLVESLNISFSENQTFDYLPLLLTNRKKQEAIHRMLNLPDRNQTLQKYNVLLKNEILPDEVIEHLKREDIVPRFFKTVKKVKVLKKAGIQNKEYSNHLEIASALLTQIKDNPHSNYITELEAVDARILEAQETLVNQGGLALKMNKASRAKKICSLLEITKYDAKKIKILADSIKKQERSKNKKIVKTVTLTVIAILLVSTGIYFGYSAYQKSESYDLAVKSGSLNRYNQYLNMYGDNDEIHRLREDKLYQIALSSNNNKDINELVRLYPKSKHLKTITLKTNDYNNSQVKLFGVNSQQANTSLPGNGTYKIPQGCVIGFSIHQEGKIPISKYFTVADNMVIHEELHDSKTMLFEEKFDTNKNNWNTFNNTKKVYGKEKHKGVTIKGGNLDMYHEYSDNNFVYSTVSIKNLKRNIDFEIIAQIHRNGDDSGTFILFGGTKRGFNYVGFNGRGNYLYGYNNWDNSGENWIKQNGNWQYSKAIGKNTYSFNTIHITKKRNDIIYQINNQSIGLAKLKKWYGNRIGFGINSYTKSQISSLMVYQLHDRIKTEFIKEKLYYCWVEELNVRQEGNRKGTIITTIKLGEPVKYLGEVGKKMINATLKELYSPDYYYKIELLDGTIGWVHGGGLRYLNTDKNITFSKFKEFGVSKLSNINRDAKTIDFYTIAVYAEKSESTIEKRVQEIKSKGFKSDYLWIPNYKSLSGAQMYCAYIGSFQTKKECKQELDKVKKIYPKAYGLLVSKHTQQRITIN